MSQPGALLAGIRVLDLCDERGISCGKALRDLGAEVIAIEPPGGSPVRRLPPLVGCDTDTSLSWLAYAAGKQSLVLDLQRGPDCDRFRELARGADIVVESFGPGAMDQLGLGYDLLSRDNPGLILTSITPFGDGPLARTLVSDDLVLCAMGGMLYLMGDVDRPPVKMQLPQSYLHAGMEAVVGTMVALNARAHTGVGQQVVVNTQACVAWTLMNAQAFPILHGDHLRRAGGSVRAANLSRQLIFPCADGFVSMLIVGGPSAASTKALIDWMAESVELPEWLRTKDFVRWEPALFMQADSTFEREIRVIEGIVIEFFGTRTKAEIYEQGLRRRILLSPVSTVADIAASPQLAAREFFVDVEHPQLGCVRMPGAFAKLSATPLQPPAPAPRLDEHATCLSDRSTPRLTTPPSTAAATPFADIRIADFSWVGVGPITSKYLADHGATVIRIESRARLDVLRYAPPWPDGKPGFNRSQFFASYNTNKSSVSLDLAKPEARELARRLVAWSNVVVESFTPKVMAQWELDYEHLRAIHPDLVMLSTCLQGQTGPHRLFPGFGQLMAALSGFVEIAGWPDRAPTPPYGAYTDFIAPRFSASVLMAAIDYRRRTGISQHIDMAQFEASLHFLAPALIDYFVTGRVITRDANRSPIAAPHGVYRCEGDDRWVAVAVRTDAEWAGLCTAIGRDDLRDDARFSAQSARLSQRDDLDSVLDAWTASRAAEDAMNILQQHGVPAGVVASCLDLHQDPLLQEWGFWHWLEHPEMGATPYEGHQFKLSRTPGTLLRAAPCIGEHNEYVLGEVLGLSTSEIHRLIDAKVVY